jgi:hypothetical protein
MNAKKVRRFFGLSFLRRRGGLGIITVVIIPVLFIVAGCSGSKKEIHTSAAFYYWRTSFELGFKARAYLDSLGVKKLYVRFFDVDWNPHARTAQPVASAEFKDAIPLDIAVIPAIFITNATFRNLPPRSIPQLASNIVLKVNAMAKLNKIAAVKEIQIDCDWTESTRESYFRLLNALKETLRRDSIQLSVTIRLHQLAYKAKTGVPPVDSGVLMFYNMGDVEKETTKNSILDLEVGRYYLERSKDYPMHLDIALPLFRWGVQIRQSKVIDLIHGMSGSDLSDTGSFQAVGSGLYKVIKSTYARSVYFYKGDMIRLEEVSLKQLFTAIDLLKNHVKADTLTVVFYHLDTDTPERFHHEDLRGLLSSLGR